MAKVPIHQEDIVITNFYIFNNIFLKHKEKNRQN